MAPPAARSRARVKPVEEPPPPPPPEKKKNKWLIPALVGAVVVLAVVATLLFLGSFNKMLGIGASAAEDAQSAGAEAGLDLSKPPAFLPLEPFTVNLKEEEGKRYLQTSIALRVADAKTAQELLAFVPEIRHRINLLLASKLPSEIGSKEAREALAEQIAGEVNVALGFAAASDAQGRMRPRGPVKAVLFNSFLIQ